MRKKIVKKLAAVVLAAVCLVQFTGMVSQARSQGLADLGSAHEIKGYAAEAGVVSPKAATPAVFDVAVYVLWMAQLTVGGGDHDKENRQTSSNSDSRFFELDN